MRLKLPKALPHLGCAQEHCVHPELDVSDLIPQALDTSQSAILLQNLEQLATVHVPGRRQGR